MDSQADVLRRREAEAREKLRRLTDALSAGIDPAALIGPINAAQADADSARVQLNALTRRRPSRPMSRWNRHWRCSATMSRTRCQQIVHRLLREFYASIGLGLTWHHDARRLCAKLDLGPAVADLTIISKTPTNRGARQSVRGGT